MNFFKSVGKALKSKTVWAGVATTALGTGEVLQQYAPTILHFMPATTPVGAGVTIALGLMTIYGRIKAQQPLGPVIDRTIEQTVEAVHTIQGQAPPNAPAIVRQATDIVKAESPRINGGD